MIITRPLRALTEDRGAVKADEWAKMRMERRRFNHVRIHSTPLSETPAVSNIRSIRKELGDCIQYQRDEHLAYYSNVGATKQSRTSSHHKAGKHRMPIQNTRSKPKKSDQSHRNQTEAHQPLMFDVEKSPKEMVISSHHQGSEELQAVIPCPKHWRSNLTSPMKSSKSHKDNSKKNATSIIYSEPFWVAMEGYESDHTMQTAPDAIKSRHMSFHRATKCEEDSSHDRHAIGKDHYREDHTRPWPRNYLQELHLELENERIQNECIQNECIQNECIQNECIQNAIVKGHATGQHHYGEHHCGLMDLANNEMEKLESKLEHQHLEKNMLIAEMYQARAQFGIASFTHDTAQRAHMTVERKTDAPPYFYRASPSPNISSPSTPPQPSHLVSLPSRRKSPVPQPNIRSKSADRAALKHKYKNQDLSAARQLDSTNPKSERPAQTEGKWKRTGDLPFESPDTIDHYLQGIQS